MLGLGFMGREPRAPWVDGKMTAPMGRGFTIRGDSGRRRWIWHRAAAGWWDRVLLNNGMHGGTGGTGFIRCERATIGRDGAGVQLVQTGAGG